MKKEEAINLLGGTPTKAAKAIRITTSAVSQWPEELTQRIEDRVHSAVARMKKKRKSTPTTENVAKEV